MMSFLKYSSFAALVAAASLAKAAITYIDAAPNNGSNGGNTTVNGVFADDTSNYVSGTGGTNASLQSDTFWYYRTPTAASNNNFPPNKGTFWETDGTAVQETTDPLITTIQVPAPGTYKLYVMFIALTVANNTAYGDIEVDVNNSGTPKYFSYHAATLPAQAPHNAPGSWIDTSVTSVNFDAASDPSPVKTQWTQQGYHMILGEIGQFTLSATSVEFKINGPDAKKQSDGTSIFTRTLYEGVAFEPVLGGDFDGDGDVDGADFVAWQTNFPLGSGASQSQGDADADGDVDGADFNQWQQSFPSPSPASVTAIPEPGSIVLMISCISFAAVAGRFARRHVGKRH